MHNNILPLAGIKVSGEDHKTFLQGQLTQDTNLAYSNWQFAAQCNPQGRVIAFFMLCAMGDNTTFLITDSLSTDRIIEQLSKYILRSKVNFEKSSNDIYFIPNSQFEPSVDSAKPLNLSLIHI